MTNDGEKIIASSNEVRSKMNLTLQAVLGQLKELKDISTGEDQLAAWEEQLQTDMTSGQEKQKFKIWAIGVGQNTFKKRITITLDKQLKDVMRVVTSKPRIFKQVQ